MIKYSLITICSCIIFSFTYCKPKNDNTNKDKDNYDLEFVKISQSLELTPWKLIGHNIHFYSDSTIIQGSKIFCITNKSNDNIAFIPRLTDFSLSQFIPIQNNTDSVLYVILNARVNNYFNAKFIVRCIDKNEEIISSDSILLSSVNEWNKNKIKIRTKNISLIFIEIKANEWKPNILKKGEYSSLWLKNIELVGANNQFSINSCHLETPFEICPIPLTLPELTELNNIDSLNKNKIIAFGETIHGSKTINNIVSKIIKNQIEKNDCKLVLIELPFSYCCLLNLYIHNKYNFDINQFIKENRILFEPSAMIDLLNWLKNYNTNSPQKVNIMGIDRKSRNLENEDIIKFLKVLTSNNDSDIDSLIYVIKLKKLNDVLEYIKKHNILISKLGSRNYNILIHALNYNKGLGFNDNLYLNNITYLKFRDLIMWQNTKFALNEFLENTEQRAILYCHFAHANKLYTDYFPFQHSLGYYINKEYNANYHVCSLNAGFGRFSLYTDSLLYKSYPLVDPPDFSLEQQCSETKYQGFYCETYFKNNLTSIRWLGAKYSNYQFKYVSLSKRVDSFIYINEISEF